MIAALNVLSSLLVAASGPELERTTDARLDVSGLVADDDVTDENTAYGELRATADTTRLFGLDGLELHLDARARYGFTEITDHRGDVTRLYVEHGGERARISIAAGRQTIGAVASARVDGLRVALRPSTGLMLAAFGGLAPHPLSGAVDPRFVTAGLGYELRRPGGDHAGGLVAQWFDGKVDRVYLTERLYLVASPELSVMGQVIVDAIGARGILADLRDVPTDEQSTTDRVDLTMAHAMIRYRPAAVIDFTLSANHTHTLLPNAWYQDYLEKERARRGFAIDGDDPVGRRRTTGRLVTNVHIGPSLTPYGLLRLDQLHGAERDTGWEGRLGLKAIAGGLGFLDVHGGARRVFEADHRFAGIQVGTDASELIVLDAGASVLDLRPEAALERTLLFDANVSAWLNFGALDESLDGFQLLGLYQAFVEPDVLFHVMMVRASYRFRS